MSNGGEDQRAEEAVWVVGVERIFYTTPTCTRVCGRLLAELTALLVTSAAMHESLWLFTPVITGWFTPTEPRMLSATASCVCERQASEGAGASGYGV